MGSCSGMFGAEIGGEDSEAERDGAGRNSASAGQKVLAPQPSGFSPVYIQRHI